MFIFNNFIKKVAVVILILTSFNSFSITYTSIANGAWNVVVTWNASGIPPTPLPIGDIINVNHNVTLNNAKVINGTLNVANLRTLSGAFGLTINGTVTNNGTITITGNISMLTLGQGLLTNNGTLSCVQLNVQPGGVACANGGLPRVDNSGNVTASASIRMGFNGPCGTYNNSGTTTTPTIHFDAYSCNSGTIFATTSFFNHGGNMTCCGSLITPAVQFGTNGALPGTFGCQNICTASAFLGGVVPTITGLTPAQATTPGGFTNAVGSVGATTTWCSFAALPIELLSFVAVPTKNRSVLLLWETASEKNNDYFTLERSLDGIVWEVVGKVDGGGHTSARINYSLEVENPYIGVSYYKLSQTDFDGATKSFDIVSVNIEREIEDVLLFPNPAISKVYIEGNELNKDNFVLLDLIGQDVLGQIEINELSATLFELDIKDLKPGMYTIKVNNSVKKFYKQ